MSQLEGTITQLYNRQVKRYHQLPGLSLRDDQTAVEACIHVGRTLELLIANLAGNVQVGIVVADNHPLSPLEHVGIAYLA